MRWGWPERSSAEEVLSAAKADGFGQTRLWSNQEWALGDRPGVQDLLEYETRVNYFLPKYDDLEGGGRGGEPGQGRVPGQRRP
jgi:hypothetical protein